MEQIRRCVGKVVGTDRVRPCDSDLIRDRADSADRNAFAHRAHFEWSEVDDVQVFSDIHGDARLLLRCLLEIGVISDAETLAWTGKRTLVVICGDLIDDCRVHCANDRVNRDQPTRRMELGSEPGANEWEVLALLNVLVSKGARIVWVMGNHELMRMQETNGAGSAEQGRYQRHVTRAYEEKSVGVGAWKQGSQEGTMSRLFGVPRCVVTVGDVVFLHADPVDVRGASGARGDKKKKKKYASARAYAEHVNGLVAKQRHRAFEQNSDLVWGRTLGNNLDEAKCDRVMPSHIDRATFVVRGHCIAGIARSKGARGVTFRPPDGHERHERLGRLEQREQRAQNKRRARKPGDFVSSTDPSIKRVPGITFGCLRFDERKGGIVSGVARVDCGASASIRANEQMSVLSIKPTRHGAITLSHHSFNAGGGRGQTGLYTPALN